MKHNPLATANATAVTYATVYFFCIFVVYLFPSVFSLFSSPSLLFLSGLTSTVAAWGLGYLYALVYNFFLKK